MARGCLLCILLHIEPFHKQLVCLGPLYCLSICVFLRQTMLLGLACFFVFLVDRSWSHGPVVPWLEVQSKLW